MRSALLAIMALAFAAAACSGEKREEPAASFATPLAVVRSAPSGAAAGSAVPRTEPLDLETFTPILALPEFRAAADLADAQDYAGAAREVKAALAKTPLPEKDTLPRRYLLGRLYESAGDLTSALATFEEVAAADWPLSGHASASAGRVLVRLSRGADARARLDSVNAEGPLADEVRLLRADAAHLLGDRPGEERLLRERLAQHETDATDAAVSLRLAELLVSGPDVEAAAQAEEAVTLARRSVSRPPVDPASTDRAKAVEDKALSLLPPDRRADRQKASPEEELQRIEALTDAKQFEPALAGADALLAALGKSGASSDVACKTELVRGRATAGIRQWGLASERLGDVATRCKDPDVHARALFLAGKYADSDKRYAQSIKYYERLEKEVPSHRLADDARLKAAQSYAELGAESRFTELLSRMADDYPGGDMVLDGMFLLALHRIEKGDWPGATTVLERAATEAAPQDGKRGLEFAGRERYYRARAWGIAGETEKSLAEYEAIVRELPLSYYMLHAYSRLAKSDPERAARALSQALETSSRAPFSFERRPEFDKPGFVRALELFRVGDVERASRELDTLGLVRADSAPQILWAVALLYERAGASKLSNDLARGFLTDWLGRWPSGDWRRAWELAFPRPYRKIVQREAARTNVPEFLVYAVMREESSFDPAAESPAKAYGLMQVIEPTARAYGKDIGVRIDPNTLKKPAVSIAVGCRVLSQLSKTFSDNPLLAVPGYNAGPRPPRRWADARPQIDFDVWVELIPYLETRRYTKRVLASRAAYAFLYSQKDANEAVKLPVELATR